MVRKESNLPSGVLWTAKSILACAILICAAKPAELLAQEQAVPTTDTTVIDADGTAHITRVIPVPKTLSPEAQAMLATGKSWCPGPRSPEAKELIERAKKLYPVNIEEDKMVGGVKTKFITPAN
jgi:epsilon-lactone hydrolase